MIWPGLLDNLISATLVSLLTLPYLRWRERKSYVYRRKMFNEWVKSYPKSAPTFNQEQMKEIIALGILVGAAGLDKDGDLIFLPW